MCIRDRPVTLQYVSSRKDGYVFEDIMASERFVNTSRILAKWGGGKANIIQHLFMDYFVSKQTPYSGKHTHNCSHECKTLKCTVL